MSVVSESENIDDIEESVNLTCMNNPHRETRNAPYINDELNMTLNGPMSGCTQLDKPLNLKLVLQEVKRVISCCECFSSDISIKECPNGHLLCQPCFLKLRQTENPQCPSCGTNIYSNTRRALVAQKVLSELPNSCSACYSKMLSKDLIGHRLNHCPKRRVACGLASIGCNWCGNAENYRQHYTECIVQRNFTANPLDFALDNVLTKLYDRKLFINETSKRFSTIFNQLGGHEIQSRKVLLSFSDASRGNICFRSDQFIINQSKWILELEIKSSDTSHSNTDIVDENISDTNITEATIDGEMNSSNRMIDVRAIQCVRPPGLIPFRIQTSIRQVSRFRFGTSRLRPYSAIRNRRRLNFTRRFNHNTNTSNILGELENKCSELSFTMTKCNIPAINRKTYAFIVLTLEANETGMHVSLRPCTRDHRFSFRGEKAGPFSLDPIRWRGIRNVKELVSNRVIQVELCVARRLRDDLSEEFETGVQ